MSALFIRDSRNKYGRQYKVLLFGLDQKLRLERDTGKTNYIDMLAWFTVLEW